MPSAAEKTDHSREAREANTLQQAEPKYPAVTNAAKELMARSGSGSGASIPRLARTAAEVADSAALLDKENPEPDISDEEAGRLGLRRLSSTPISIVARTAAEVADSAQALDLEVSCAT